MSLYWLAAIGGILGGALFLIFSLLALAQRGDVHLDQMGLGEGGGWLENHPSGVEQPPENRT